MKDTPKRSRRKVKAAPLRDHPTALLASRAAFIRTLRRCYEQAVQLHQTARVAGASDRYEDGRAIDEAAGDWKRTLGWLLEEAEQLELVHQPRQAAS